MTRVEASELIESLECLRPASVPQAPQPTRKRRPGTRVTQRQLHFICFLLGRLGWLQEPGHPENFLHKYFHVERVEDIRDRKQASAVIEALKAILKRKAERPSSTSPC